jgi:hypothetical protein
MYSTVAHKDMIIHVVIHKSPNTGDFNYVLLAIQVATTWMPGSTQDSTLLSPLRF